MSDMDMKVRKRMDMGGDPMATTSDDCYATNIPWLETLAYCFQQHCVADRTKESQFESRWKALAANGFAVASYQSILPLTVPTAQLEANATWLNTTSLVNEDVYFANHQTLQEFEFQEDMHVRLS